MITEIYDHGTIWQLVYETEDRQRASLYFDHRPFAQFYQAATGHSLYADYQFGAGRAEVYERLRGMSVWVEGEGWEASILPDDSESSDG